MNDINWDLVEITDIYYYIVNSGSCSISVNEETVIYQSSNPYPDNDYCHVEFGCPDNQILSYQLNRFNIEQHRTCRYDYLGISCILLNK